MEGALFNQRHPDDVVQATHILQPPLISDITFYITVQYIAFSRFHSAADPDLLNFKHVATAWASDHPRRRLDDAGLDFLLTSAYLRPFFGYHTCIFVTTLCSALRRYYLCITVICLTFASAFASSADPYPHSHKSIHSPSCLAFASGARRGICCRRFQPLEFFNPFTLNATHSFHLHSHLYFFPFLTNSEKSLQYIRSRPYVSQSNYFAKSTLIFSHYVHTLFYSLALVVSAQLPTIYCTAT